jgi:hypothetical protein
MENVSKSGRIKIFIQEIVSSSVDIQPDPNELESTVVKFITISFG